MKRGLLILALAGATWAQTPTFDSGVVSRIPARNVGSATMSGRISALAARVEADQKVTLFVGAASGGLGRVGRGGRPFSWAPTLQTAR